MMLAPAGWLWTESVPKIGAAEAASPGAEGTDAEDTGALLPEECFGCLSALFSGDGEACAKRVPGSTAFSGGAASWANCFCTRSEEHTSELQSLTNLVCR